MQQHLQRVYLTLAAALAVSAIGVWVNLITGLGGLLAIAGFVVCAVWLTSTQPTPYNVNKRCEVSFKALQGLVDCKYPL